MGEVKQFGSHDFLADRKKIAKGILEVAASMDPETVIVFCYRDGVISVAASEYEDSLQIIGALEAAKMEIWNDSYADDEST